MQSLVILDSLQEQSSNVDAQSDIPGTDTNGQYNPVELGDWLAAAVADINADELDLSGHEMVVMQGLSHPYILTLYKDIKDGDLNIDANSNKFNDEEKFSSFLDYIKTANETTFLIGGHSLWFKNFMASKINSSCFQCNKMKKKYSKIKLKNTQMIKFTLYFNIYTYDDQTEMCHCEEIYTPSNKIATV